MAGPAWKEGKLADLFPGYHLHLMLPRAGFLWVEKYIYLTSGSARVTIKLRI
jgi:hypothetical protein